MSETVPREDEKRTGVQPGVLRDETEHEQRDEKRLVHELATVFNMIDRLVTMMRVYPRAHPLVDDLAGQVVERFSQTLGRDGHILVRLNATELTTELGHPFYSAEVSEKGQFIWYEPYADGILHLEFFNGLTPKELQDFLGIVSQAHEGHIGSDDDSVTLLWELKQEHIKYFAVEGFIDSGQLESFGNRSEPEAIRMLADAAINPSGQAGAEVGNLFGQNNLVHIDLFTRMQIEANAKMVVPELRDRDLAYAFKIDRKTIDHLFDEWASGADLEYRLIEALLSILRTAPKSKPAERASELITSIAHQLIEREMFTQTVKVLQLLHDRRELFDSADFDPLAELITALSDPMQLEAMLNMLQNMPDNRSELLEMLSLLDRKAVQRQVLLLLANPKRDVIALPSLVDLVIQTTEDAHAGQITEKAFVEQPVYLTRMLGELRDRDVEKFTPTVRLIRAAIDHASHDVRLAALSIPHSCWNDPRLAEQYLVPMATDPHEDIRKRALELLGERHVDLFTAAIRDTILARDFKGRPPAELRFLMRVYLKSDPKAADFLRSLLETKGWLSSSKREFAKLAASVLAEAGDQKTMEILEAASESAWTAPALRKAFSSTLRFYGGGRAELAESSTASSGADDEGQR